jgi:hypothetical protein
MQFPFVFINCERNLSYLCLLDVCLTFRDGSVALPRAGFGAALQRRFAQTDIAVI